jgi:hypothetical protein
MLPELLRTLKAGPTGELTYVVSADGKPMAKEVIGNLFRAACRTAGVKKSAHGLRKQADRASLAAAAITKLSLKKKK